jgi:hypothetical protein
VEYTQRVTGIVVVLQMRDLYDVAEVGNHKNQVDRDL